MEMILSAWQKREEYLRLRRETTPGPQCQWEYAPNAGFCKPEVKPWMRVNDDFKVVNAEAQMAANDEDSLSVWQYWRRGLANRKEHADAFIYGDYRTVGPESDEVFAYIRIGKKSGTWLVVLNFSGQDVDWPITERH